MKRIRPVGMLLAHEESGAGGSGGVFDVTDDNTWEASDEPPLNRDGVTHERARQLILEQAHRLLPPAEANALADHLLICDPCYRFAQDAAARERRRTSGELK
jgi:hypothetical protein